MPLPPTCQLTRARPAPPHGLHLLDLAHWGLKDGAEGEWPQSAPLAVKPQVEVLHCLLNNPNAPPPKEQEQTPPREVRTAKNAKLAAVALLSTIYSQQADKPALQSAASDLLQTTRIGME